MQSGLLSLLLANDDLSEASLTYAESTGIATNADIQYDAQHGGTSNRGALGERSGQFIVVGRGLREQDSFSESRMLVDEPLPLEREDRRLIRPAISHFRRAARKGFYGRLLWTDLHWSQIDEKLPQNQRRVEVSVQKAIEDSHARFAGVLRVGLLKDGSIAPSNCTLPIPEEAIRI